MLYFSSISNFFIMKKTILKFTLLTSLFALFAISFNFSSEAQSDPAGICPDGPKTCARDTSNGNKWHKGNVSELIQPFSYLDY